MELCDMTALELGERLQAGEVTQAEAIHAAQARIKARSLTGNSFITVLPEPEEAGLGGGVLWGVPMGVKDNLCTKGIRTTCASQLLEHYIPHYDATVIRRLKAGGGILLGKLNMDEFAMGSTTGTSYFGPAYNPWDQACSPGGSSGGAAAAVATGECWYALGSDAGGSVRQPASYCGVTGMKPTYGAVSRYGLISYASSLEQVGPIARTAADCAAVLDLLLGRDPRDASTQDLPGGSLLNRLNGDLRGLRIGIPGSCFGAGLASEVAHAVLRAGEVLRTRGAQLDWCRLALLSETLPAYYVLACAEASSNLSPYHGARHRFALDAAKDLESLYLESRAQGFGAEVKRRILLGSVVLSTKKYDDYYQKAQMLQEQLRESLNEAFSKFDLLLLPTAPTTAPQLSALAEDTSSAYLSEIYTIPASLLGLPAISVPCGFDSNGLPIGAQLIGPAGSDAMVLNAAHSLQMETSYHKMRPF